MGNVDLSQMLADLDQMVADKAGVQLAGALLTPLFPVSLAGQAEQMGLLENIPLANQLNAPRTAAPEPIEAPVAPMGITPTSCASSCTAS